MAADVGSDERAEGNDLETELAHVIERSAREAAGEAGAFVTGLDLGTARSASSSASPIAAMFSSRCTIGLVPGISSICS